MNPVRREWITTLALAVHRGRTVPPIREGGWFDGRARTEYAITDPAEYPFIVFDDPPDTTPVSDEEYPPERSQFERDCWRDKGC